MSTPITSPRKGIQINAIKKVRYSNLFFGTIQVGFLLISLAVVSVTAEHYCGTPTPKNLWHVISCKTSGLLHHGVIILHSNSRPHTADWTCDWLQHHGWEVTDHRPYTPNIMAIHLHLSGPLKSTCLASNSQQMQS